MKRIFLSVFAVIIFVVVAGTAYFLLPDKKEVAPLSSVTAPKITPEPIKPSVIGAPLPVVNTPSETPKTTPPPTNVNKKIEPTPVVVPSTPKPVGSTVVPPPVSVPVSSNRCVIPSGAGEENVSNPTTVVGNGTSESCTSDAVIAAVKKGGVVTFSCGAEPVVIKVPEIKIYNNGGKGDGSVTIDGGNKITLAAVGANRIIYQNTCDESLVWTSPRCDIQGAPHLALQNITLSGGRGDAGDGSLHDVLGGGAVYVRGGTFKAYNIKVIGSRVVTKDGINTQDVAGGAIYTFGLAKTATIVNSVFENNSAPNGGAIGGLFTSYTIMNTKFDTNKTTGHGMNPAKSGTMGGGLGGAIYNDGNGFALNICGTEFKNNSAAELGSGSIFMVANDLKGKLLIDRSVFTDNSNVGSVQKLPSIYVEAGDKRGVAGVSVSDTTGL